MSVFQTDLEQKTWMNQIRMAVYQMTDLELEDFLFTIEVAKTRRSLTNLREHLDKCKSPFVQVDLDGNEWTEYSNEEDKDGEHIENNS